MQMHSRRIFDSEIKGCYNIELSFRVFRNHGNAQTRIKQNPADISEINE